jgi:hypothetical protein
VGPESVCWRVQDSVLSFISFITIIRPPGLARIMVDYYILLTTTRRPRLTAKLVYFPTWKCLRIFRVPNENLSVQNPLRKNRGIEVRSINSKVNFRIVIIRNQSRELRIVCLLSIQPMEKQNESIWEFLEQNYFGYYYYIRGEKEAKKVKLQSPYWLTLV